VLVECKAANVKSLAEKHIEQAGNYASRAGICWVVLTNGIEWRLYHLTFVENEGITHDLAFEMDLPAEMDAGPDAAWGKLALLGRESVARGRLEEYWSQKKALSPASVVRALFTQDVLLVIRRELNRKAPARLDVQDVFNSIRDILSKEALLDAGDISIKKSRKRRRRVQKTDAVTGETVTEEVEEDVPEEESAELPSRLTVQPVVQQAPKPPPAAPSLN